MRRATAVVQGGEVIARITLDHDARHRRRRRMQADDGLMFLLDLPEARRLADGERLLLEDGTRILVVAATEPVADLRCPDAHGLVRLAWHLGNRHTPAQVTGHGLRIRRDHVLLDLARRLGAEVTLHEAPFEPETGAYAHGPGHEG